MNPWGLFSAVLQWIWQYAQVYAPLLAWGALVLAFLAAFALDRAERARLPSGDTGALWARVVLDMSWWLIVLGSLSFLAEQIPSGYWWQGWHLFFDRTGSAADPIDHLRGYAWALGLPFALFAAVVAFEAWIRGRDDQGAHAAARWLAGSVSADGRRTWVLLLVLPIGAVLYQEAGRLGGGANAYPGFLWGALATIAIALVFVAVSAGRARVAESPAPPPVPAKSAAQPDDWPAALRRRGIDLETLVRLSASPAAPAPRGSGVPELKRRLDRARLEGVAPEVIEALAGLINPFPDRGGLERVVYAPDHCGQLEAAALGAVMLDERFHSATLVVCATGAEVLAARLAEALGRLGQRDRATLIGGRREDLRHACLWVADANTLSDVLLPMLKDFAVLRRVGMIVWWQVHEFTGVLGANIWAVSRRLHRMVETRGREDLRVLAFVRSALQVDDQASRFVKRLLPSHFGPDSEVLVPRRCLHPLQIHVLLGHPRFFAAGDGHSRLRERVRFPALVAALVSAEAGWPTCLEDPPGVSASEARELRAVASGEGPLGERLVARPERALAYIAEIGDQDLLSLLERVSATGAAVPGSEVVQVGLRVSANPYAEYLLATLAAAGGGDPGFDAARRLVGAEAHPAIFKRHLLLALNEMEDTGQGLLEHFLWREDVVAGTLNQLYAEERLRRREVRFLDARERLVLELEYKTNHIPSDDRRPLDTVGTDLIAVREATDGGLDQGVRLRLDPERLTIHGYPLRVFVQGGERYRIREWQDIDKVFARGWLECQKEQRFVLTWRIRTQQVRAIEGVGRMVRFGRGQGRPPLGRLAVSLTYVEEVEGVLRVLPDLTTGAAGAVDSTWYEWPITQEFRTRALVLQLPGANRDGLNALAQGLRHVLPVHVGADADALEVIPVLAERIGEEEVFGVAVVDLYPGGIGLIEAIEDDNALLLDLLGRTRRWLEACGCQSDDGCVRCLRSFAAQAANPDRLPRRRDALDLLATLV